MTHTLEVHTNCQKNNCMICDGGLAHCTTCGGFEGTLPTDCPGQRMTEAQAEEVYAGKVDYLADKGGWIRLKVVEGEAIRDNPDGTSEFLVTLSNGASRILRVSEKAALDFLTAQLQAAPLRGAKL